MAGAWPRTSRGRSAVPRAPAPAVRTKQRRVVFIACSLWGKAKGGANGGSGGSRPHGETGSGCGRAETIPLSRPHGNGRLPPAPRLPLPSRNSLSHLRMRVRPLGVRLDKAHARPYEDARAAVTETQLLGFGQANTTRRHHVEITRVGVVFRPSLRPFCLARSHPVRAVHWRNRIQPQQQHRSRG